ncbi:hypothetical protein RvY_00697, partial [Ramazzottius varieornatus]
MHSSGSLAQTSALCQAWHAINPLKSSHNARRFSFHPRQTCSAYIFQAYNLPDNVSRQFAASECLVTFLCSYGLTYVTKNSRTHVEQVNFCRKTQHAEDQDTEAMHAYCVTII